MRNDIEPNYLIVGNGFYLKEISPEGIFAYGMGSGANGAHRIPDIDSAYKLRAKAEQDWPGMDWKVYSVFDRLLQEEPGREP